MADIEGECDERFAPVRAAFAKNFDDELEVGASVAVVLDGETVVDLWGGWSWEEGWRRAEIPAANGHGNARSVAAIQSRVALEGGGLLSASGCETIFEQQASGTDLVLGVPLSLGIGYGLNSDATPLSPNRRTCFWGGWGGSLVINDLDAHLCIAYMMNRMGEGTLGDMRGASIAIAAYTALAS